MNQLIAALLCTAFLLTLSGCGHTVDPPATSSSETKDTETPQNANTEPIFPFETKSLPISADLNHDGELEQLELRTYDAEGIPIYEVRVMQDGAPLWWEQATDVHPGWNALFLCPVDGKDYLLRYRPTMYQGGCEYAYQVFSLDESGEEVAFASNDVAFDINFDPNREQGGFDPAAIAAFMDEVNGYLAGSTVLFNNDHALDFPAGEPLRDTVWWLRDGEFPYDDQATLLENLRGYENWALARVAESER